jgi:hypothetical protein
MADITFKFKRGSSGGSSPSGLTHGELAVNTTDNRLFVGSVTGSVNAINNRFFTGGSTPSYPIEGDRWYTGTVEKFYYSGNWVTAGGASGSSGSSFDPTQLLVFNSGVSGSGGATFAGSTRFYGGAIVQSGGLSVTGGATITGGVALYGTITVNGAPISSGIANVPLASSSATGVASFGNQFVVSNAGAVGLTSNYVISVNGMTGAVTLTLASSAPLASSSATGVASFGNEFVVSAAGAVGLTSNYVKSFNGSTGTVSFAVPLASSSATGVASFGNEFVVSAAGAVSLTSNYVKSVNGSTGAVLSIATTGSNTFTGLQTLNAGLTTTHLHVTNGATFAGTVSAGTISAALNGNASTATILATARTINQTSFNGSSNINIDQMFRADKRHISPTGPSGVPAGYSQFVFTTWTNTLNTTPYADGIHFRTYQDASGGKDNLLMLNKSVIGMRLWQQEFGSATAYTAYKDVAFIQDVVTSFNGLTGAVSGVTTSAANTFTALNTFNAGLTTTHLHVTKGVTFAGTSVHTGLGTFNGGIVANGSATFVGTSFFTGTVTPATFNDGIVSETLVVSNGVTFGSASYHAGGITSNHLYVTNGATFAGTVTVNGSPIGNVSTSAINTFTVNQNFQGGISANGLTAFKGRFAAIEIGSIGPDSALLISRNIPSGTHFTNQITFQVPSASWKMSFPPAGEGIVGDRPIKFSPPVEFAQGIEVTAWKPGTRMGGISVMVPQTEQDSQTSTLSGIHSSTYNNNGVTYTTLPARGVTFGGFALGVHWPPPYTVFPNPGSTGSTGYGFLHLLQGGTGPGTTSNAAIRVIRANNTQAYINYAGEFYGLGTKLTSDAALKSNIIKYTESTVSSVPIPTGKWLPDIRNFFQPYTFTYNNAPELGTKYGYLAQEIASVDSKVAGSNFILSEGDGSTTFALTGTTNYFISQDQLLFGAIEAIRELDAEVCRLWKTSSAPPPSRAKDNDLWFDPTTSKMYLRFNDGTQSQWIQPS